MITVGINKSAPIKALLLFDWEILLPKAAIIDRGGLHYPVSMSEVSCRGQPFNHSMSWALTYEDMAGRWIEVEIIDSKTRIRTLRNGQRSVRIEGTERNRTEWR